jgi:hypothetical protein
MSALSRIAILDLAALMLAAAICSPMPAQLSPWSSIPSAPSQSVQLEQSLLVVTQGSTVHAFSALTKGWTSVTTLFGPPSNTLLNEHLIVRDGPIFYGFSPRTGSFQSLVVLSPAPVIVNSSSPQTWHSIIIDGNYLHVFYAFTGHWMTYVFAGTPVVSPAMNGRFCFLVADGSSVYAASSFYESLVPAPAGASATGAYGNVAIATSAGMVHGFSASRNTWASMPVSGAPTIATGNAQPAFVSINDGNSTAMFSGHTGSFTTIAASPGAPVSLDRYVAIVVDGTTVHAYSALLGTEVALAFPAAPTVIKQQMYALLDDGSNLTAYSAAKGAFAAPIPSLGMTLQSKAQIAALTPAGSGVPVAVYSSYRNEWNGGPGIGSGTAYFMAASIVVEADGGGLHGWSQRGSAWIDQPAPTMDTVTAGTSPPNLAETFFSRAGTTIYTFNPRTEAWRTATTGAPATLVRAHHAVVLAHDGSSAYGFNIWDDQWTSVPLQAPYLNGAGQVQAAWVTDGIGTYAYGGFGQTAMISEFPDFYRVTTLGSRFMLEVAGEPGASMLLAISAAGASIPVPPFGTLLLDPASLGFLAQAAIPPDGVFALTLQIPTDPGLSGMTPHLQAAIAGPSGVYLTNSVFPTIY